MRNLLLLILITFYFSSAQAVPQIRPAGINGSVGFGIMNWDVREPETFNIKFDQGQYIYLGGERGFEILNLYLTLSLAYMTTTGESNYSYTTVSTSSVFTGTDIDFNANFFQVGLGLKMKLIDGYWFRPYAEIGGLGGYFTVDYTEKTNITLASGPAGQTPKYKDSLLDFGSYLEGGLEASFSDEFGVKLAARFIQSETKKLETLAKRNMRYNGTVYFFSLLKQF